MAGGRGKIQEHPNKNTNGFRDRPQDAGRKPKLPDLDIVLAKVMGEEKDGMSAAEALLARLRQQAIKGDTRAAQILLEHAYGKPRQRVELFGGEDIGKHQQKTVLIQYRSPGETSGDGGDADGGKNDKG